VTCTAGETCQSAEHLPACPRRGYQGLTPLEHHVIARLGSCWDDICRVVGDGPTRDDDLRELRDHIHAVQRAIGSQAAARAHPACFRLLGERLWG